MSEELTTLDPAFEEESLQYEPQKKVYTEEEKSKLRSLKECEDEQQKRMYEKRQFYEKKQWYALYVHPQHEFQIHDYLLQIEKEMKKLRRGKSRKEDLRVTPDPDKMLMECYVPSVREHVRYSDRMVWKERVQTPGLIFVKTDLTAESRRDLFSSPISPYVTAFVSDRVRHRPLPIGDAEMDAFRKAVDEEYAVVITVPQLEVGQKVRIAEGAMEGYIAEIVKKSESVVKNEYQTDRTGQLILDADGNPIPKRKVTLQLRLNTQMAANFEVSADKVYPVKADAADFELQE